MNSIIYMGLLSFIAGCSHTSRQVPNASLLPPPFDFVLIDHANDNPLITNQSQDLKLWYIVNGQSQYIDDLRIRPIISSGKYAYYATSVLMPLRSSDNVAKTFYLELDGGKIDTISLNVVRRSEPVNGEYNEYREVKYNGQAVALDLHHQPALFVFRR